MIEVRPLIVLDAADEAPGSAAASLVIDLADRGPTG